MNNVFGNVGTYRCTSIFKIHVAFRTVEIENFDKKKYALRKSNLNVESYLCTFHVKTSTIHAGTFLLIYFLQRNRKRVSMKIV